MKTPSNLPPGVTVGMIEEWQEDDEVPADFPVKVLGENDSAEDRATCGTCGRSWDDAIPTSLTPAPSARCPFEAFHDYDDDEPEQMIHLLDDREPNAGGTMCGEDGERTGIIAAATCESCVEQQQMRDDEPEQGERGHTAFSKWLDREDHGDTDQLRRCWKAAQDATGAPELLAALKGLVATIPLEFITKAAKDAIAKAEGRS